MEGSMPAEGTAVETGRRIPWHQRPIPTLAVAVALPVVCGGCAVLWLRDSWVLARPVGLASGAIGLYLLTGGIVAVRSRTGKERGNE